MSRTISNQEHKQMRSDMAENSAVSTRSDAAALQNDLAQRYNLQSAIRPSKKKRAPRDSSSSRRSHGAMSKAAASASSSTSSRLPLSRQCDSCQASNPHNSSVCEACGYFLAGSQQMPLTMAQSRGLVAAPRPPAVDPLQPFEWESIEKGLASRQDAYCPICMEGFNRGFEVLLSCSHMYHRSCLQSFEKFMKTAERSCPICRTTNYQKKITVSLRALLLLLPQGDGCDVVLLPAFNFWTISSAPVSAFTARRDESIRVGVCGYNPEKLEGALVSKFVL